MRPAGEQPASDGHRIALLAGCRRAGCIAPARRLHGSSAVLLGLGFRTEPCGECRRRIRFRSACGDPVLALPRDTATSGRPGRGAAGAPRDGPPVAAAVERRPLLRLPGRFERRTRRAGATPPARRASAAGSTPGAGAAAAVRDGGVPGACGSPGSGGRMSPAAHASAASTLPATARGRLRDVGSLRAGDPGQTDGVLQDASPSVRCLAPGSCGERTVAGAGPAPVRRALTAPGGLGHVPGPGVPENRERKGPARRE